MPTVLRVGPYRFAFFSSDRAEPPHVHVTRDRNEAKYWIDPIQRQRNRGFKQKELREIERLIVDFRDQLLESWNEYFNG